MVAVEGITHVVRYANPAFRRLLGKEEQHLIGRRFTEAVPEGMANGCGPLLDRVFDTGTSEALAEQQHRPRDAPEERGAPPSHWSYLVWAILGPVGCDAGSADEAHPHERPNEKPVGVMIQVTDTTELARFRSGAVAINEALLTSGIRQHQLTADAETLNTALRESEARLQESETKFRTLADQMSQFAWMADKKGSIFWYNRRWYDYTGTTLEEMAGWGWKKVHHPDHVDRVVERLQRSWDSGEPWEDTFPLRSRLGGYRWFLSRALPIRDEAGNIVRWLGTNTDVTEQRVAEEALRTSEALNRRLFQSVPAAVFSCDRNGVVQDYNRRAEEYWGRAPVRGNPAERYCGSFKLYLPDGTHLPHEQSPILQVLRDGVPRENVEVIIERPDRSRLPVLVNFFPLTDEAGEISGAITCFSDITQIKRFEGEREALLTSAQSARTDADAANRSKDLFLATLSHEMRTPLNAIVGWMSILRREGCNDEDLHEGLDVIDRNTRVQVQLIDDVLDVASIVSGKLRLEINPCDLTAVVKAGIDVLRPAAEAKNITLKVELDPGATNATCDPVRIQQVVWNLAANAVKFTPKGGTVSVGLWREHSELKIRVTDSGQGISADLMPFVFDRFRQADSSTRRKFGGLGLGLSIVKQLVELHGGAVEASSAGEGRGSTFTVTLPVCAVTLAEHERSAKPGEKGSKTGAAALVPVVRLDGLRILVVDDEPDARRLLVRELAQAGATVATAGSAAEAMAALKQGGADTRPHVLISDVGMPDENGFDLIKQVRSAGHTARDLPAVALTAFVQKEDRRQVLLAGFQMHMPKPVDLHDLTVIIASLAGRTG